jgi:hypothetical protein
LFKGTVPAGIQDFLEQKVEPFEYMQKNIVSALSDPSGSAVIVAGPLSERGRG